MAIPKEHKGRYIYHFTHMDNIPGILAQGFLANNHPKYVKKECRSVAAQEIQARRAEMEVTCGPCGKVHDYVPLYFGAVSPMLLAVINKKNVDQPEIVYFEFPIELIERKDVVFTDAAANGNVPPKFYTDPDDLTKLNWKEIDSRKWKSESEVKQQRMAEILVHSRLAVTEATRVVVWNERARERLSGLVKRRVFHFRRSSLRTTAAPTTLPSSSVMTRKRNARV